MNKDEFMKLSFKDRFNVLWTGYNLFEKIMISIGVVIFAIGFPILIKEKLIGGSDSSIVDTIWNAYINQPGNVDPEFKYTDVHGKLIKKGNVSPDRMNTSVKERLPAYLACYDFVQISSIGDSQYHLCMYYVDNPSRNIHYLMWRGDEFMHQLEEDMALDDFRAD